MKGSRKKKDKKQPELCYSSMFGSTRRGQEEEIKKRCHVILCLIQLEYIKPIAWPFMWFLNRQISFLPRKKLRQREVESLVLADWGRQCMRVLHSRSLFLAWQQKHDELFVLKQKSLEVVPPLFGKLFFPIKQGQMLCWWIFYEYLWQRLKNVWFFFLNLQCHRMTISAT